ncbi:MAG: hypothetical protein ACYC2X_02765 [Coriobacteriia bacterium]
MGSRRVVLRVIAVVLSLSLVLLATGCGSSYGDPEPGSSSYQGAVAG